MDLTEGKDIKKRWQEYTEEPYKKYLNDPDNHNGVFFSIFIPLFVFPIVLFSLQLICSVYKSSLHIFI